MISAEAAGTDPCEGPSGQPPRTANAAGCRSAGKVRLEGRPRGESSVLTSVRSAMAPCCLKRQTSSPRPRSVRCAPRAKERGPSTAAALSSLVLSRNSTDRTQTGHVLGAPLSSGEAVASDRQLAPVVFLLMRLLTHVAMLLGAARSPEVWPLPPRHAFGP